ncbi:MAG: MFS transporter [Ramlibacter sp.]|nr:MFS transporter [Ramlibacter sp.]
MRAPSVTSIFAMLSLMLVLSGLDQTVLSTALPSIVDSLHGQHLAPWVFSAYLMASTAVIPLYGKLADRWGVRRPLLVATAIFTLGSLACALATSMPALVGARALQGLGGGGLMTMTMLAVASIYPQPAERGRRMGLLGAVYGISTLVGPLVGGLLLQVASWHWAFMINVPLAGLAWLVLQRSAFGASRPAQHRLDLAGAALLALGLTSLLLATRGDLGAQSQWLAAAAGCALLLAWGWLASRVEDPVLPLTLFRSRPFAATAAVSILNGVALFATVVYLPLYLQRGLGYSAIGSAGHTFPLMLGVMLAAQVSGRALRGGHSVGVLTAVAAALMALGFVGLTAVLWWAHVAAWAMGVALFPVGAGLGLMFPLVTVVAQRSAPVAQMGVATAIPVMLRSLGGALGVAALGEGLSRHMAQAAAAGIASREQAAQALASGVASICLWCCLAALAALGLSRGMQLRPAARPAETGAPAKTPA